MYINTLFVAEQRNLVDNLSLILRLRLHLRLVRRRCPSLLVLLSFPFFPLPSLPSSFAVHVAIPLGPTSQPNPLLNVSTVFPSAQKKV